MSRRTPPPSTAAMLERGERFIAVSGKAGDRPSEAGQDLARQLRSAAIDLASDKATEFSPDIAELTLLAAKVAWLSFEAKSAELELFERDIDYCAHLQPPSRIAGAYQAFKKTVG